jgi:hypothetical protein
MCRPRAVILVLLAVWPTGCLTTRPDRSPTLSEARRAFQGPVGEDVVHLQVALIERPAGDRYLNQELWELVDDEGMGFERKKVLKANGLRVCQIGGQPPAGLLGLMLSSASNPNPRGISCRTDKPIPVQLGPPLARCGFQLLQDGDALPVDFDQAQCQIDVVPHLADDNRIRLHFVPRIKHGEVKQTAYPLRAPSGVLEWGQRWDQEDVEYPALAWDLTVGTNELVVIGTRPDWEETLGHRFFINGEGAKPIQRLLVLRLARAASGGASETAVSSKSPPLASRAAGLPSVRGSTP